MIDMNILEKIPATTSIKNKEFEDIIDKNKPSSTPESSETSLSQKPSVILFRREVDPSQELRLSSWLTKSLATERGAGEEFLKSAARTARNSAGRRRVPRRVLEEVPLLVLQRSGNASWPSRAPTRVPVDIFLETIFLGRFEALSSAKATMITSDFPIQW